MNVSGTNESIPIALINTLRHLKLLEVYRGKLQLTPGGFNSTSLEQLYLYETELVSAQSAVFKGMHNLKELKLYNVQIENISTKFFKGRYRIFTF